MNDNLEPYKSYLLDKYEKRGRAGDRRYPQRDAFRRLARMLDPRLAADFDELYYACHSAYVIGSYKQEHHALKISAEKLHEVVKMYSADTFPRLRGVVTHNGCYFCIIGVSHFGQYTPIAHGYRIFAGVQKLMAEGYYEGKVVHHQGNQYTITENKVFFYTEENMMEQPEQEDLFA